MSDFEQVRLEVVFTPDAAQQQAETAYRLEKPGFQIDPIGILEFGRIAFIEALEQASISVRTDTLLINTYTHSLPKKISLGPHIDGGMQGLGVHRNKSGHQPGGIQLAKPSFTTTETGSAVFLSEPDGKWSKQYEGNGIFDLDPSLISGPVFVGDIVPDMITVFYEGDVDGTGKVIHFFDQNGARDWERYGSQAPQNEVIEENRAKNLLVKDFLALVEYEELLEQVATGTLPRRYLIDHPGATVTDDQIERALDTFSIDFAVTGAR
jgi:hypothetical protein